MIVLVARSIAVFFHAQSGQKWVRDGFFQTMYLVGKSHSIESTAMRKKLLKYNCCIIHSKNCFVHSDSFL